MLTEKQEKFAQGIALEALNQSDAYRAAYHTEGMSGKTVHEKASRLASRDAVRDRIRELRESVISPKIMSARERQAWLTEVIQNPDVDVNTKLKASDQLNKMTGEYAQKPEEKEEITIQIGLVDDG